MFSNQIVEKTVMFLFFPFYFGFFSNILHVRTLFLLLVLPAHALAASMRQGDGPCGVALLN